MKIYAVNIADAMDSEVYLSLLQRVSPEKRQRIDRFIRREDATRTLVADVLVRSIICNQYGVHNKEINFSHNDYGKPLVQSLPSLHFNVSHSGDWVVCAVDTAFVGIDIEQIKSIDLDLAQRFFAQQEYDDLMQRYPDERVIYFYDLWTLKESYIKALGKGLSIPLNSFAIRRRSDGYGFSIQGESGPAVYFKQYDIDRDYKLSVCGTSSEFPGNIILQDAEQINQALAISSSR